MQLQGGRCAGSSRSASPSELDVGRILGLDLDEPELALCETLDPRGCGCARDLGTQPGDVGLQLRALATDLVEGEVQSQHGDVDRDDAGEQNGEKHDPDDAAAERPRSLAGGGSSSWSS